MSSGGKPTAISTVIPGVFEGSGVSAVRGSGGIGIGSICTLYVFFVCSTPPW